jgi:hypothetical protein
MEVSFQICLLATNFYIEYSGFLEDERNIKHSTCSPEDIQKYEVAKNNFKELNSINT